MALPFNPKAPIVTTDGQFTEDGKQLIKWVVDLIHAEAVKTADPVAYRDEFIRRFLDDVAALGTDGGQAVQA